ncbi:hypothetical protein [Arthrobacter sp. 9V]|uniref:hypothetical protein n=1 Tax=Arthrobacter sp. 9V TaxID=2653132 RepID=UPI00135AFC22|nr:hypothetical protein [Arthrobacter sp. 9V]
MPEIKKWEFKRLIDELSDDQYSLVIQALRDARLTWPGWTDRLSPTIDPPKPAEPFRFHIPLMRLVSALDLVRTGADYSPTGATKGGIWLQPLQDGVRMCSSSDFAAAICDLEANVDVPGTAVIDSREFWQIVDALRKGLPSAARAAAIATIEHDGEERARISVGGRSHLAAILTRVIDEPELPPRADATVRVHTVAGFKQAVPFASASAGSNTTGPDPREPNQVALRTLDGRLVLDAIDRYSYAQSAVLARHDSDFTTSLNNRWLQDVTQAISSGEIHLGETTSPAGKKLVMIAGSHWAAWTSKVAPWKETHNPADCNITASATFNSKKVFSYLSEAKRLAESSRTGYKSGIVRVQLEQDFLHISSATSQETARTGSIRVEAQTNNQQPASTYLAVQRLHGALRHFTNHDVTIHLTDTTAVYLTTPGYHPATTLPLSGRYPHESAGTLASSVGGGVLAHFPRPRRGSWQPTTKSNRPIGAASQLRTPKYSASCQ